MIELLKDLYNGYYLGDNEVVLTIYLTAPKAGEFYKTFIEVLQPADLRASLTWDFVDESDAIVIKGSKEVLVQLKDFLDMMGESFKVSDAVISQAVESDFSVRKMLIEHNLLNDANVYECMKCGKIQLWGKYGFPIQMPVMCDSCGSYLFKKN